MINTLPKTPKKYECGIVNLDTSDHVGAHWIFYFKKDKIKYVFDSFGGNPPKQLVNYYLGSNNLKYNEERIQNYYDYICGHLCLIVLKSFSDGYNFNKILNNING
jgi:hypothetical protein